MLGSFPVSIIVGILLGFLAGLGIGGGSLLILWLTFVLHMDPAAARSVNLLFFLPSAIAAIIFRVKSGNIHIKKILPAIISGCAAAALCAWLSGYLNMDLMKKLFGGLLIITGLREMLYKSKKSA